MVIEKQEEAFNFRKDSFSLQYLFRIITGIIRNMKDSLNIAIVGATGYVGLQLVKILSKHPKANIVYLCAQKSVGKSINSFDSVLNKK